MNLRLAITAKADVSSCGMMLLEIFQGGGMRNRLKMPPIPRSFQILANDLGTAVFFSESSCKHGFKTQNSSSQTKSVSSMCSKD